jgi:Flp pilus assembly protein TadD
LALRRAGQIAIACTALLLCGASRSREAGVQLEFGVGMARREAWREAEYRFRRALDLAPGDAEILNNLAVACESNGLYAEAEKYYVQALEANPKDRTIRDNFERFRIFYAQFLQKDLEEAKPAPADTAPPEPS